MTEELLAWDEPARGIPESGLDRTREATPEERDAIKRALDLVVCKNLTASYTLTSLDTPGGIPSGAAGRYKLAGTLQAVVEQTCVVTLAPLTSTIEEAFEVTFWPPDDIPAPASGAVDIADEAEPEPIVAGRIPVGRVVFESLAGGVAPFPRAPGAAFDWQPGDAGASGSGSPFAALAKIKK